MADEKQRPLGDHAMEREYVDMPGTGESTERMSAGRYFATRLTTLKPPMEKVENPIALLRMLNAKQWLFFLCAFIAWTWDAFDFFTVWL